MASPVGDDDDDDEVYTEDCYSPREIKIGCESVDEGDLDSVRDRARMSVLLLYRLLQKGYTTLMPTIMGEEAVEIQRKKVAAALQAAAMQIQQKQAQETRIEQEVIEKSSSSSEILGCNRIINHNNNNNHKQSKNNKASKGPVFQECFAGSLLSQAGFNLPLPVKYEALIC